jgi:dUTPase
MDLAVHPPAKTYCQTLSRSGLILNHGVEVKAGQGDRIAQLIVYPLSTHRYMRATNYLKTSEDQKGSVAQAIWRSPVPSQETIPLSLNQLH